MTDDNKHSLIKNNKQIEGNRSLPDESGQKIKTEEQIQETTISEPSESITEISKEENEADDQEEKIQKAPDNETIPLEPEPAKADVPGSKWYVIHTYSGHENRVSNALKQRIESEHLEHKILDILMPTQEKIEIRSGKKELVKEKIFPGYIMIKMVLDENSWLAVRTTPGVTSFIGIGNKPTPIPESEIKSIVTFMTQGAAPTFKDVFLISDTVKIIDGPFADFIGKVDSVDKEKGKVRILVSIFGRETPVELDFLQITKL